MQLIWQILLMGVFIIVLSNILFMIELYISFKKLCKRVFKDKRVKEYMATLSKEECKKLKKDLVRIPNKFPFFWSLNSFYTGEINNILNKQELFDRFIEDILGD